VISDNDDGGGPDGLVQLAHLLLSPNVDVRFGASSHLREGDPFDASGRSAAAGAESAASIDELCGRADDVRIVAGADTGRRDRTTPVESEVARSIVAEPMRADTSSACSSRAALTATRALPRRPPGPECPPCPNSAAAQRSCSVSCRSTRRRRSPPARASSP
jgi:hypothetical protein